jgi:hypothetical protein
MFDVKPWEKKVGELRASAVKAAEALPESVLLSPPPGGVLEDIVAAHQFAVATINASGIRKTRNEVQSRSLSAPRQTIPTPVFRCTIPFTGDAESFYLRPTQRHMYQADFTAAGEAGVLTVRDDDDSDAKIDEFLASANKNLGYLREDAKGLRSVISAAVQEVVTRRTDEIKARDARDAKSKYKMDK